MALVERSYVRIARRADSELWLIRWPPGSIAPMHDHGGAEGTAVVLAGELEETIWIGGAVGRRVEHWTPGRRRTFASDHRHEVANRSGRPAISLHRYAPRLDSMTFYTTADRGELVAGPVQTEGMWA